MPIRKFKYIQRGQGKPQPMLWIKITNPENGKTLSALAVIDTGGAISAFPIGYARILQYNLQELESAVVGTAAGPTNAFFSVCTIEIINTVANSAVPQGKSLCTMEKVRIAFFPELEDALLGVDGVLDGLVVEVDYLQQILSIRIT